MRTQVTTHIVSAVAGVVFLSVLVAGFFIMSGSVGHEVEAAPRVSTTLRSPAVAGGASIAVTDWYMNTTEVLSDGKIGTVGAEVEFTKSLDAVTKTWLAAMEAQTVIGQMDVETTDVTGNPLRLTLFNVTVDGMTINGDGSQTETVRLLARDIDIH